jgi:hypothetical protein
MNSQHRQFDARRRAAAALLLSLFIVPLGSAGRAASTASEEQAGLFDLRQLLEVKIEMAPADWDALRREHRDLLASLGPARLDGPPPNPYKTYKADVTIGGTRLASVGVRKRGFIGSASATRPSLGLRFDAYDSGKSFCGLDRISLNNNLQDPSQLHQVLAYRVFAQAGVAAPRCSLARVTVNGKDLGVYSHVEAVEAPFLTRHFGRADGNLYEGQLSDFRPDWVKTFEKKNRRGTSDRADLEAVVRALESDDAHLLDRLGPVVDLEAYLSFWAVETLIGHWDSYSNNGNNFFVYRPPDTGRFVFIPWGTDGVMGDKDPFTQIKTPESVFARSLLPRRLYLLPATQARYRQRLRRLLDTVWNERELLAEVDRLERLIAPHVHVSPSHFRSGLGKVRQFIRNRRAELLRELDGPAPGWEVPLKTKPYLEKAGTLSALFSTTWRKGLPANPLTNGTVTLELHWDGKPRVFATTSAFAGPGNDARNDGLPTLTVGGLQRASLKLWLLPLVIETESYRPRSTVPVNGFTAGGALIEGALLGEKFRISGVPIGALQLHETGTRPGDNVSGRLQVDLYRLPE